MPYLLLAAVVLVAVPIRAAYGPIRDIDLYWHLLVGQDILSGTPVAEAGRGWSFAPVPDTWISTQWLAEILFAKIEAWGGLDAFVWYRTITTVVAVGVLAAVTLWRRPVRAGVWVFALAGLSLAITAEDRSQQLTFMLAPLVGWWAERLWREGRLPRWWLVLPLVVVWANYHGGWVILPLALGLAMLARLVDSGWRDPAVRRALVLIVGVMLAACVSPSGLDNALAARRFNSSTTLIIEWQAVNLRDWTSVPLIGLLLILAVAWARGRQRPSRGELVLVLGLIAFSVLAWRNLTPAVLMLAPILTGTLARALGEPDPTPPDAERPRLLRTSIAVVALGLVGAVVMAAAQNPVVDPSAPLKLFAKIKATSAPQRVLNTYNAVGPAAVVRRTPAARHGRDRRPGGPLRQRLRRPLPERADPGPARLAEPLRPARPDVRAAVGPGGARRRPGQRAQLGAGRPGGQLGPAPRTGRAGLALALGRRPVSARSEIALEPVRRRPRRVRPRCAPARSGACRTTRCSSRGGRSEREVGEGQRPVHHARPSRGRR